MMALDHVGDQEAMVYAQLGQQPLARTTETSLEPRLGTLSGLSARPPDLAFWTGTRPPGWWACPRALFHFYTPSARRRRDPRVRVMDDRSFCRRYEHTSRGTTLYSAHSATTSGRDSPHTLFSRSFKNAKRFGCVHGARPHFTFTHLIDTCHMHGAPTDPTAYELGQGPTD